MIDVPGGLYMCRVVCDSAETSFSSLRVTMSPEVGPLLLCLLAAVIILSHGLHLTMDRTPESIFCAQLTCVADRQDGNDSILAIVGLRLFKVALNNKRFRLASVSVFDSSPHLELLRSNFVNLTGNISRSHGDLTLGFQDESDCLYGSFPCELNFVNVSGQPEVLTKQTAPQEENLKTILLSKMIGKIESHSVDVENEFTQFKNQTSMIESKLDNLLKQQFTQDTLREWSDDTPQLDKCYRGMPNSVARETILLWDSIEVLCDTLTDGGGWIVIQRRTTGTQGFDGDWDDYKSGFGTVDTDYWLGNDYIHNLTSLGYNELRFDLKLGRRRYFAHYSYFRVADEASKYKLTVNGYHGTAEDSFTYHSNTEFSTKDNDNDKDSNNCAQTYCGGWWYAECYDANLNGLWATDSQSGVIWGKVADRTSMTFTEMKIRKVSNNIE